MRRGALAERATATTRAKDDDVRAVRPRRTRSLRAEAYMHVGTLESAVALRGCHLAQVLQVHHLRFGAQTRVSGYCSRCLGVAGTGVCVQTYA